MLYYDAVPCQRCESVCQQLPDEQYTCVRVCVPTNRNEEAACAFTAPKEVPREQLQPCVVSVKYHMFILFLAPAAELCKPSVLRGERGGGIALSEVEDEIEEGWDGAGSKGLDARHGDRRRSCVRGEWNGSAISDQTIRQSGH